ncbi:MAG: hypothetical protein ACO3MW_02080 [Rhodospirillales bacterium]
MPDPVKHAVSVLNDALERDSEAITRLVNLRVDCNDRLAAHATIQVADYAGIHKIGVLGLLNAALANSPSGVIGAKGRVNADTGLFVEIKQFVDLRAGKFDELA